MPPKSPGTSYSSRPLRRLRLPKIGPSKTKSLFEEYFYAILAVVFAGVAILAKAGGMSGFNAVVVGAWIAAFLWFASQWKGYRAEKSKAANGNGVVATAQASPEGPRGPLPLPSGMKPMIGPQWPVKTGPWPARPGQGHQRPAPLVQAPVSPTSGQISSPLTSATPPDPKKKAFVYERPTLPDRKPKLPHNWGDPNHKKPGNKNLSNKKPKR
jgi:hypothetical protein